METCIFAIQGRREERGKEEREGKKEGGGEEEKRERGRREGGGREERREEKRGGRGDREREEPPHLSPECDDTREVTFSFCHTLEVTENTLQLCCLCHHPRLTGREKKLCHSRDSDRYNKYMYMYHACTCTGKEESGN